MNYLILTGGEEEKRSRGRKRERRERKEEKEENKDRKEKERKKVENYPVRMCSD